MTTNNDSQTLPDWENPAVFEKNQVKPHTTLIPYKTLEQALKCERTGSPYYHSLNGRWKFNWAKTPDRAPENFYQPGFNHHDWDEINVPANWQMEGYGHPMFRNTTHTFKSNPPFVPADYNPVGSYYREFTLPGDWEDKQIFLHFAGVKSASYVWINGQNVGYNQGGMEPAEYDITDYLNSGKNTVAVRVLRYSDGTYLECQDMWRLSGIYRDVYLMATPKVHIQDYYITSELDNEYQDAVLNIEAEMHNYSTEDITDYDLQIQLFDPKLKPVFADKMSKTIKQINGQDYYNITVSQSVDNPLKWSAEFPSLYTVVIELFDRDGNLLEILSTRFGFREIEIKEQAIYVNGIPIKFNGVNSHMQHPKTGRMVDQETLRKDLILMKQFNVNCVRTCHYPPNVEYLEMADELGLYIIDETGDEAHGNEYLSADPDWKAQYLDRMRKMVYRDRNHPSIIIWSAGNESGWGDNICAIIAEGKKIDSTRPGWLYGGNLDRDPATNPIKCEDIVGPRYLPPFQLKQLFAKVDEKTDPRPSFMDEYLSAAGNSLGGLDEYWDLIYQYPRLTGGAIWDWISPGLKRKVVITPDNSANNIKCSLMGTARLVPGKEGKGVYLSGNDDFVEAYQAPELDISGKQLTLSLWVYPFPGSEDAAFITKGNHQYGIVQNGNELEFYACGLKRQSVLVELPEDWAENWHHLAGIYDGLELKLYLDGRLAGKESFNQELLDSPFALNLGRNAELDGQDLDGKLGEVVIDQVRVFDKAVTIDQLNHDSSKLQSESVLWLDFEEAEVEGDFYSLGIGARSYGLIWPDRVIKPELWQLKKSAQPVSVTAVDLESGLLKIYNRHHFKNLAELKTTWKLTANDQIIQQGNLELDIPPLKGKEVKIPLEEFAVENNHHYHLLIEFRLAADLIWGEAGHEIAFAQFELPVGSDNKTVNQLIKTEKLPEIKIEQTDEHIQVSGEEFSYQFNKLSGILEKASFQDHILFVQGPKFNVWRAPLANELDNWPVVRTDIGQTKEGMGINLANGWYSIGLNKLKHEVDNLAIQQLDTNKIMISVECSVSANNYTTGFTVSYNYLIFSDGQIKLTLGVIPAGEMTHWLPKIGLQLKLPQEYQQLKWFGRGPFENYPDRKTGAKIGVYNTTLDAEYVPYIIPQDYGNKTDVYWSSITNRSGQGLFIVGDNLFNFSAQKYDLENLTRALHTFQLKESEFITLNIDNHVTGVGGSSISVLNKYRVLPVPDQYTIYLKPYNLNNISPAEIYKTK